VSRGSRELKAAKAAFAGTAAVLAAVAFGIGAPFLLFWFFDLVGGICGLIFVIFVVLWIASMGDLAGSRDSDGSPEGRDATRLDGEAATARAEGIAPTPSEGQSS